MSLGIFAISAFSILAGSVLADSFYPSEDGSYCQFAQTVAVSYSDLPLNGEKGVYYDSGGIEGVSGDYFATHDFFDVGEVRYPDARRFNGVADHVAVPPNTRINIGMFGFNYAGHPVTLLSGKLFLSLNNPEQGNLNRLGAGGSFTVEKYKFRGVEVERSGFAVDTGPLGVWGLSSWTNPPRGKNLYSFRTLQPLVIKDHLVKTIWEGAELILDIRLDVANISNYRLRDIYIEDEMLNGSTFKEYVDFAPGEIKSFKYRQRLGLEYPLEFVISPARVVERQSHIETAAKGANSGFTLDPDSKSLITIRDDVPASNNWSGRQGDFAAIPSGDFLSVELLPYELRSKQAQISLRPDLALDKKVACGSGGDLDDSVQCGCGDTVEFNISVENTGARAENIRIVDKLDTDSWELVDRGLFSLNENDQLEYIVPVIHRGQSIDYEFIARLRNCEGIKSESEFVNTAGLICDHGFCDGIEDTVTIVMSVDLQNTLEGASLQDQLASSGRGFLPLWTGSLVILISELIFDKLVSVIMNLWKKIWIIKL
jgi:hypothetical protein